MCGRWGRRTVRTPLVIAYEPCVAANRTHGPPLAFGSCNPPRPFSDARHGRHPRRQRQRGTSLLGFVKLERDRRRSRDSGGRGGRADHGVTHRRAPQQRPGRLQRRAAGAARCADHRSHGGAGAEHDPGLSLPVTVPCAPTPGAEGATCSISTTFDAIMPGAVTEGRRAMWQLGAVEVHDGGSDGLAATGPNEAVRAPGPLRSVSGRT